MITRFFFLASKHKTLCVSTIFLSFLGMSCIDIVHNIKISKSKISGQMHIILPRKLMGKDITEGNGSQTLDSTIEDMEMGEDQKNFKTIRTEKFLSEDNVAVSILYEGNLLKKWNYKVPEKKSPAGLLLPYEDKKSQSILVIHNLPDKLETSENPGGMNDMSDMLFGQFTYKMILNSDLGNKYATYWNIKSTKDPTSVTIKSLPLGENQSLYILPMKCISENCVILFSAEEKPDTSESLRIVKVIRSKLIENQESLKKIEDEKKAEREKEDRLRQESEKLQENPGEQEKEKSTQ